MNTSVFNPDYQSEHVDAKIVVALERVAEVFRVLLWSEGKENALSPIQLQILIFLRFHDVEKRTVSYLAREFAMTKATISDAVKALEQKQYIEKKTHTGDSRSSTIHLTNAGKKRVEQAAVFANPVRDIVLAMSDDRKSVLLSGLAELLGKLHEQGLLPVQRMCYSCTFYAGQKQGRDGHFCALLGKPLHESEIRIDCPEHKSSE